MKISIEKSELIKSSTLKVGDFFTDTIGEEGDSLKIVISIREPRGDIEVLAIKSKKISAFHGGEYVRKVEILEIIGREV